MKTDFFDSDTKTLILILAIISMVLILICIVDEATRSNYDQYVPRPDRLSEMKRECEKSLPRDQVCKVKVEFYPTESVKIED